MEPRQADRSEATAKLREVWAIRIRLQIQERLRDLAMFNLAIDSKLRGCDLVALRVDDVLLSGRVRPRTTVIQKKTSRPVQFEITEQTRETVMQWIIKGGRRSGEWLFPSRIGKNKHLTTRHYARLMDGWVTSIGLDPVLYGTHSLRRTKVALIYRRTGNLRAVQLLLGHTKLESTVRYLGIEVRRRPGHFRAGGYLNQRRRHSAAVDKKKLTRTYGNHEGCTSASKSNAANCLVVSSRLPVPPTTEQRKPKVRFRFDGDV